MKRDVHPYLSIVVCSRNDNHGGDLTLRMNLFVKGLIQQFNSYQIPAELIMVEWNPPADKENLKAVLPKAPDDSYLSIRFIEVPKSIHSKFQFSEQLPIFQMIAKNVGIRRALGEFILCTNIDLLFSDELMLELSAKKLEKGKYYRANRCDIPSTVDYSLGTEDLLQFAKNNILQRLGKNTYYPNFQDTTSPLFKYAFLIPVFQFLSKLKKAISKEERELYNALDMNACGDFTLMSKEDWENIDGYPELEMYSLHIDSMALFACAAKGIKQHIFKPEACTYHVSHKGGWEFQTPTERIYFYAKRPILDWWAVYTLGMEILKNKTGYTFNDENWGLNNLDLKTY